MDRLMKKIKELKRIPGLHLVVSDSMTNLATVSKEKILAQSVNSVSGEDLYRGYYESLNRKLLRLDATEILTTALSMKDDTHIENGEILISFAIPFGCNIKSLCKSINKGKSKVYIWHIINNDAELAIEQFDSLSLGSEHFILSTFDAIHDWLKTSIGLTGIKGLDSVDHVVKEIILGEAFTGVTIKLSPTQPPPN
jgi:hypothetical protein